LLGVVRDDERTRMGFRLCHDLEEQSRVAQLWSEGLITGRRGSTGVLQWVLLSVFGFAVALALMGALFSNG
jgi:hypothetical protein